MIAQRAGRLAWSRRAAAKRLPWLLLGVYAVLCAVGVALLAQVPASTLERAGGSFALSATFVAVVAVFAVVGAVVAARAPRNPIGWLFLALGLLEGLYECAYGIAAYGLANPGSVPGEVVAWAGWASAWTSPLSPVVLVPVLLLFPTGRPPSPRWRVLLWLCAPLAAAILVAYALQPGPLEELPAIANPAVPADATWIPAPPTDALANGLLLAAAVSLVVRFRRAGAMERQQLKWFALAVGVFTAFLVVGGVASTALGEDAESAAVGYLFAACIALLPLAVGIAILRHRLFDIDLVIRRTLVYGALTVMLAAGYGLGVLLAQAVIGADSDLAIAGSTLAMAALFRPLRARVQATVDRRFYRRRYDAARTLEAFGARLRDELDLDEIGADLRAVAERTVQPAHVSLWLRGRGT